LLGAVIDDYTANLEQNEFKRKVVRCLQLFGAVVGRDTPVSPQAHGAVSQPVVAAPDLAVGNGRQHQTVVPAVGNSGTGDKAQPPPWTWAEMALSWGGQKQTPPRSTTLSHN
jgi:hypothetical protein